MSVPPSSIDSDPEIEDSGAEDVAPDSLLRAVAAAPTVKVEPSRLAPGTVIDATYRVAEVLGSGAMGVVYEAEDLMLDRRVAVKLHDLGTSEQHTSRMWREAKAMARLSPPNVVTVYEVGWHQGSIRAVGRTSAGTDEALRWLGAARAEVARSGDGPSLSGDLDTARAEVLLFGDRFGDALAWTLDALARTEGTARARARLLTIRATALERLGRYDEALAVHHDAIALAERSRGADHPAVAAALANVATTLAAFERGDEAVGALRRALAIREAVFGPDAPGVGETHRQLGDALHLQGMPTEAKAEYERAVAIHRAADDGAGEALALANLAGVLGELGDNEAAVEAVMRARPLVERHFGARSVRMGELSLNAANYLWATERVDEALQHAQRALAILEVERGPDTLQVGAACLSSAH